MDRKRKALDNQLDQIVSDHVSRLVANLTQVVRQNVANEIRAYFDVQGGRMTRVAGDLAPIATRARRILPCIAPGCKNPSKGPRFHYLCEQHRTAPRREWEAWRRARQVASLRRGPILKTPGMKASGSRMSART